MQIHDHRTICTNHFSCRNFAVVLPIYHVVFTLDIAIVNITRVE